MLGPGSWVNVADANSGTKWVKVQPDEETEGEETETEEAETEEAETEEVETDEAETEEAETEEAETEEVETDEAETEEAETVETVTNYAVVERPFIEEATNRPTESPHGTSSVKKTIKKEKKSDGTEIITITTVETYILKKSCKNKTKPKKIPFYPAKGYFVVGKNNEEI